MNMQALDWAIVLGLLGLMTYAALGTRKYNQGVADFLSVVSEGGHVQLSAREAGVGRGGYISELPYSLVNSRLLLAMVVMAMTGGRRVAGRPLPWRSGKAPRAALLAAGGLGVLSLFASERLDRRAR